MVSGISLGPEARSILKGTLGAALVAFVLTGCAAAVSKPAPAEPPHPLVGTWRATLESRVRFEGDEIWRDTRVEAWLTFTGERAIRVRDVFDATTGEYLLSTSSASGWRATDTAVTRYWTPAEFSISLPGTSVEKAYQWGNDERTVLIVDAWSALEDVPDTEEYERVPDADLPAITGRWQADHGFIGQIDLEVSDESFEYRSTEEDSTVWVLTGNVDSIGSGIVQLSHLQVTTYDSAGAVTHGPEDWGGGSSGRLAYVPRHRGLAVSLPWFENDEERPYGGYFFYFVRTE